MTIVGTVWSPRGPSPMNEGTQRDNGLCSAIAINPNDASVIYLGTAGGGTWRSNDGGANWTPQFDRQAALGIGEPAALAIDPNDTDTIYIGTSARVTPQTQAGLFKSTDGGNSCVRLGSGYPARNVGNASQFVNQWVNVIIVDPADSQTVYLASTSGVFVSRDGGLNWTKGTGMSGDARSLVLDRSTPAASRALFAGIVGDGAYVSTNGGQSWTRILSAATAAVAALVGAAPRGIGKVVIDIAPPTSPPNAAGVQVLYASLAGTNGAPDPVGFFRSTDRGATWTARTATGMPTGTQGSYSFHFAVDPASPGDGTHDTIYFGCVGQARSTDSGNTFTAVTGMHADTHAWAFARPPGGGQSTVYCGNDGGLFVSTNGTSFSALNGGGLQTGLFYNIDSKRDAGATVIVGALQDNQIETTSGATAPGWTGTNGGDGWDVVYDGGIAAQLYCTSGFWSPAPCTRVFRSTDDGVNWSEVTPWGTATDAGCYLAPIATDPSNGGTVYVSGSQNLWQSRNSGNTWRIVGGFPGAGNASVAPSRGDNVVVAVGSRVFVSTNALAATVGAPNGVVFTDITRNLPSRSVQRAAFDPNDPTVVYAVLGGFNGAGAGQRGHVFRTTVGGTAWEDISPPVDIPHGALELDGTDTPSTIYVGTDLGVLRSVDGGLIWTVLDDIHFPRSPVTDLVLARDARILRAATYGRGVFEFAKPTGPAIAVDLQDGLDFGVVCLGRGAVDLTLQIFNVGVGDLTIDSVQRLMGSSAINVLSLPGTPLVIAPGEEVDLTVEYVPTTIGASDITTIRIESNDPVAPVVDLTARALTGTGILHVLVPDDGDFGEVCLGSFVDEPLTINNSGTCPLLISDITGSPGFLAPSVLSYPLLIDSGDSIDVVIRFQPSTHGPQSGTITIVSNDPASPHVVVVSGVTPEPKANPIIADTGDFGEVRLGRFVDRDLVINNRGPCPLSVTGIVSSAPTFVTPQVSSFPLTVDGGDSIAVPIRFQPTNRGSATATLTIVSNDPNSPAVVNVSGTAWPPLPIAGTALEGYPLIDNSQHVFFIGTDKYVHELDIAAGGIWNDNDLTTLAGAVPPTPTSAVAGFPLGTTSKHIFFIGTDKHVYELYFTAGTGWVFNDLTSLARAVPPTPTCVLAGHPLGDDSKHVFFIGTDNHVHELFIVPGGRWADNDLTTLAGVGAKPPTPTSALTSHRLSDGSQHVFFIGTDTHVHELFINGGSWADNDLTALAGAGAVPPTPTSDLTAYPLSDGSQHVFFIGTDTHVHELDIDGAGWADNDLTTLAGAVPPTPTSALTGYQLGDKSKHVFFIGTDDHVHELYLTAGASWVDNDLTALT